MGQSTKELFAIDAIERACECPSRLRYALEAHVMATGEGIRTHLLSRQARLMATRLLDEGRIIERYERGISRLYPE
ncbi:MAG: hypothetical protein AAF253_08555 [Pseudomonadota bacterium]